MPVQQDEWSLAGCVLQRNGKPVYCPYAAAFQKPLPFCGDWCAKFRIGAMTSDGKRVITQKCIQVDALFCTIIEDEGT